MAMEERLQKIMAARGVDSRRKCEALITDGRVKVNGQLITELGYKADPTKDRIEVDGKRIEEQSLRYVLLNKPRGVITSVSDPEGRRVVTDFIPYKERMYPVGRLDYDTSGLLLLTNDGELTNKLTHPRFEMKKTYEATINGTPTPEALESLRNGIELEDGMTAPAGVVISETTDPRRNLTVLKLTIHEGRNRQVRRMLEAIGHNVISLQRIQFGPLMLGRLKRGDFRVLQSAEIQNLKESTL